MGKITVNEAKKRKSQNLRLINQLKRDAKNETNKYEKRRLNKRIKGLEGSLPYLRRVIFEGSSSPTKDKKEEKHREKVMKEQEEIERKMLLQNDLKKRREKIHYARELNDKKEGTSNSVCQSCGVPYNYSSGFSRCRCN